jgi:hypothetical protein
VAFKKIDADAVDANQPLDAFVTQGVAANLEASRLNRFRRTSMGWPAGLRPVLSAHKMVAYPLAMWPVSDYARQVTIEIRHEVEDASVHMGLATVSSGVLNQRLDDLTEVVVGSATTSLTMDVFDHRGSDLPLFLVVISEGKDDAESVTIDGATDGNVITSPGKVRLPTGHGLTIIANAGDRWRCSFSDSLSGSANDGDETYPGSRTVLLVEDAANDAEIWVWPRFSEASYPVPGWSYGNYVFTVETIGKSTVKGIEIYEDDVQAFDDLQGQLVPAAAPVARHIGSLYRQGFALHRDHTQVHHAGPTFDTANQDGASSVISGGWGEGPVNVTQTFKTVASCWVGTYATNSVDGGTSRFRNRLRVSGFMVFTNPVTYYGYGFGDEDPGVEIPGKLQAVVNSFSFGSWNAFPSASAEVDILVTSAQVTWNTAHLWGFTAGTKRFHNLRGAVDYHEFSADLSAGLIPFAFEMEDDGHLASTQRTLQLQCKMSVDLNKLGYSAVEMHCVSLTVRTVSGVYGT